MTRAESQAQAYDARGRMGMAPPGSLFTRGQCFFDVML